MGAVYLAREESLERLVAVKVLSQDRGLDATSRERFKREARTAARLMHPNIVPLHAFGEADDGLMYLVMGYVSGESLADRLKRDGRLRIAEARRIVAEIAEALDHAHRQGVVHRDVKPDNVLIEDESGRALLADFGVAKALGAGGTMTQAGSVVGTPDFMSPEQAAGNVDVDGRSDLYSLGALAYSLLAGRPPFDGDARAVLASGRPPVRGRDAIRAAYANAGGALALRALAYSTEGAVGYIIGAFGRAAGGEDSGKFILALKKVGDRWMIAADIDNSSRPPRPMPQPTPSPQ